MARSSATRLRSDRPSRRPASDQRLDVERVARRAGGWQSADDHRELAARAAEPRCDLGRRPDQHLLVALGELASGGHRSGGHPLAESRQQRRHAVRRLVQHQRQLGRRGGVQQPLERPAARGCRPRRQEAAEHEPRRLHAGQGNGRRHGRRPGHHLDRRPRPSRAAATRRRRGPRRRASPHRSSAPASRPRRAARASPGSRAGAVVLVEGLRRRARPTWASSRAASRVSSATTRSASRSASAARGVRSPRLPIGVPTTAGGRPASRSSRREPGRRRG